MFRSIFVCFCLLLPTLSFADGADRLVSDRLYDYLLAAQSALVLNSESLSAPPNSKQRESFSPDTYSHFVEEALLERYDLRKLKASSSTDLPILLLHAQVKLDLAKNIREIYSSADALSLVYCFRIFDRTSKDFSDATGIRFWQFSESSAPNESLKRLVRSSGALNAPLSIHEKIGGRMYLATAYPRYALPSCTTCHGFPKSEKVGNHLKDGKKIGDFLGSVVIFVPEKLFQTHKKSASSKVMTTTTKPDSASTSIHSTPEKSKAILKPAKTTNTEPVLGAAVKATDPKRPLLPAEIKQIPLKAENAIKTPAKAETSLSHSNSDKYKNETPAEREARFKANREKTLKYREQPQ